MAAIKILPVPRTELLPALVILAYKRYAMSTIILPCYKLSSKNQQCDRDFEARHIAGRFSISAWLLITVVAKSVPFGFVRSPSQCTSARSNDGQTGE